MVLLACLTAGRAADANNPEYVKSVEQWRAAHADTLKSDTGWLNVAGLFWLKQGPNRAGTDPANDVVLPDGPKHAGVFTVRGRAVTYRGLDRQDQTHETKVLRPNADVISIGRLKLFVIVRSGKIGLRMRDPESRMLREFSGLNWYPVQPEGRIVAKFVEEPRKIRVPNVLGQHNDEESPGYALFEWNGKQVKLYPTRDEKRLFFIFRDKTSGHGTYGAGRFLYADLPKDGSVLIDLNKVENPPCAFTPFATCPLPPKENRLDCKIEAGERDYGHQ